MTSAPRPVLVFLARGNPPEGLIALHALLAYHERSAMLLYSGDYRALLSKYLSIPFIEEPWSFSPPVYRDLSEVRGILERGEAAGILVQASNGIDAGRSGELHAVARMTPGLPLAYLDMADEAGRYDLLSSVECRYLKGSIFREFPLGADVEAAPYLHWGLPASAAPPFEIDRPRPIDVCFLGSRSTHPTRKEVLRRFERWSLDHADRVRAGLFLSEPSGDDRLSPGRYSQILGQSKICLDLWGRAAQTRRLYEGMSAGCLVLSQAPRWFPCAWTPVEGVHFAAFHSPADLIRKIEYFLGREDERKRIALQGRMWVSETFAPATVGAWLYDRATGGVRDGCRIPAQGGIP